MTSLQHGQPSYRNRSRPDLSIIGDTAFCIGCGRATQTAHSHAGWEDASSKLCRPEEDGTTSGYLPLQAGQKEIRLFALKPGEPADPIITGRIFHCVLGSGEQPPYEAISYTWADETGGSSYSHKILCELPQPALQPSRGSAAVTNRESSTSTRPTSPSAVSRSA